MAKNGKQPDTDMPENWVPIDTEPIVPGVQNSLRPVAAPPPTQAAPPQLGNYFRGPLTSDIQHDAQFVKTGYQTGSAVRTPLMPTPLVANPQNTAGIESVIREFVQVVAPVSTIPDTTDALIFRATWNSFTNYSIADVVLYNTFLYVAIASSTNITPAGNPAYWTQLGGPGSVTSVALTVPSILSVAGSPITTAGTLAVTLVNQAQNTVFAGLTSGTGTPAFRLLVAADIPNLPASIITSGQLALARGGTHADLSGTGGTSFVLRQSSVGADITVSQLAASDLSNGTTGTGAVALADSPTFTTKITTANEDLTGKITKYNNISTVDNGVPSELGHADLTGQTAAKSATTLLTPAATGRFRISAYLKVTTPDGVSSTLGGVTITFTDGTDSVAQSMVMQMANQAGAAVTTNTGDSTTSVLTGTMFVYAKTGVAIQYAIAYTSNTPGNMAYAARLTCEAM